jgi:hypothetical protein
MQTLKLLLPLIRSLIIILAVSFILWLVLPGCTTYKCQPSHKSKDYAHSATIKKVKEGWLVTERNGFTVITKIYECWPICETTSSNQPKP